MPLPKRRSPSSSSCTRVPSGGACLPGTDDDRGEEHLDLVDQRSSERLSGELGAAHGEVAVGARSRQRLGLPLTWATGLPQRHPPEQPAGE